MAAGRAYAQIRHQSCIANSVFCRVVAGCHLDALLDQLTPEELSAVHATPGPSDLRIPGGRTARQTGGDGLTRHPRWSRFPIIRV